MNRRLVSLLIVDDDPQFVDLAINLLDALDAPLSFQVTHAENAEAALGQLRDNRYDLVFLDNKLPGADGIEVLGQIQQSVRGPQPAVIMLTATGNEELAVEAMKRGARDYLPKLELGLPGLQRAIVGALERQQLERQLREKNEHLQADLRMARDVQRALLPQQFPAFPPNPAAQQPGLRFCQRYQPAVAVGGDFFDVLQLSNTQAGILICDVMGHGLRAALVTAVLRGMIEELRPLAADPGRFLGAINGELYRLFQATQPRLFVSAFYLVVDVARGEFRYARAGHPSPLLLRRRDNRLTSLPIPRDPAAVALGVVPGQAYRSECTGLQPEDLVILYTDGLFEVEGPDEELFGEERLRAAVTAHCRSPVEELFDGLLEEVRSFSVKHQFTDDVCLVGVEVYDHE